ncbi:uncharacterized protein LOC113275144 isoform X2 [Papaver somniferum]|uniref:uncharacterized protein LOC113275144 isoform X2 n=1 Tax=Papaver somniferum TaxID=3469 RepID=UPI000E6FBBFA|nr:uncharacterized protein LOC113275144 isoform X2 [Papaver somniferum]
MTATIKDVDNKAVELKNMLQRLTNLHINNSEERIAAAKIQTEILNSLIATINALNINLQKSIPLTSVPLEPDNTESTPVDADSVRNFTQSSSIPSEDEAEDDLELITPYLFEEQDDSIDLELIPSYFFEEENDADTVDSLIPLFFFHEKDWHDKLNVQPKEVLSDKVTEDKLMSLQ